MEGWEKDWLKPETLERFAAGAIFGGVVTGYFLYRVLKSGFFMMADKATLIAENAVLVATNAELTKDLNHALAENAKLKGGGQG